MNRRKFFSKLGLGALAALIAPKLVVEDRTKPNPYYAGLDAASNNCTVVFWHLTPDGWQQVPA